MTPECQGTVEDVFRRINEFAADKTVQVVVISCRELAIAMSDSYRYAKTMVDHKLRLTHVDRNLCVGVIRQEAADEEFVDIKNKGM